MKKVNKERYPIKRDAWGSVNIYSVEYKWTSDETLQTTNNIVVLIGSKQKAQGVIKSSMLIQDSRINEQTEPERADS